MGPAGGPPSPSYAAPKSKGPTSRVWEGPGRPKATGGSDGRVEYRPYGKSDAARRSLKIPEFLRQALIFQVATHSNLEWVFPAPGGGFLRYENFRSRFWVPAAAATGISSVEDPFTFH